MIIESEVSFQRVDHKDTTFSFFIKATISFTSIILVGLVFYYHRIDINLYCVDNSIDDWRIALTRKKNPCNYIGSIYLYDTSNSRSFSC
jgi:potassium intermediate/small conductance calcium-activated channel subfamily N